MTRKTESLEDYLKRGGQIEKVEMGRVIQKYPSYLHRKHKTKEQLKEIEERRKKRQGKK
jgi:hypothetical protein